MSPLVTKVVELGALVGGAEVDGDADGVGRLRSSHMSEPTTPTISTAPAAMLSHRDRWRWSVVIRRSAPRSASVTALGPRLRSPDLVDRDVVHDLVEGCGELTELFT